MIQFLQMDMRAPTHKGVKWSVSADVEALAWDPHTSHSFVVSLSNHVPLSACFVGQISRCVAKSLNILNQDGEFDSSNWWNNTSTSNFLAGKFGRWDSMWS